MNTTDLSHFFPDSKQSSMLAQRMLLKPIQGPLGKFHLFLKNCYKPPTFSVKSVDIVDDKLKTNNWTCFKTGWHQHQTWVISNNCWITVWHTSKIKAAPVLCSVVYTDNKHRWNRPFLVPGWPSVTGCYAHPVWQDVTTIQCDRMLI